MLKTYLFLLLACAAGHLPAQAPYPADRQDAQARKTESLINGNTRPDSTLNPLIWRVRDRVLKTGETVNMDFLAFGFTDIAAYQFALKFDPAQLRFERIEVLAPGFPLDPSGNFGLFNIAGGELRTLWSTAQGITLPAATPVFRIVLTTLSGGKKLSEALILDPAILSAVAYNTVLAPKTVQLYYADFTKPADPRAETGEITGLQLDQNRPNPFNGCTQIGFTLPEAGMVKLRVLDVTGREWLRLEENCLAGYREETVCLSAIPAAGLFYYELTTPYGTLMRRMIKSD
jgi:hypothetical protein